jgi:hypothetical protein
MTRHAVQLPPLVCKSCKGTGIWDVGTEDEGPCGADHCHGGVLVCVTCNNQDGDDEPAVGTVFNWNSYVERDEVFPLCRRHLQLAHAAHAAQDRGDYERDMRKDGGW